MLRAGGGKGLLWHPLVLSQMMLCHLLHWQGWILLSNTSLYCTLALVELSISPGVTDPILSLNSLSFTLTLFLDT